MSSRCISALAVALLVGLGSASGITPAVSPARGATPPAFVTITMSRTGVSAADHSVGGEGGTCTRDNRDIASLDKVVLPWMQVHTPSVPLTGSVETGFTQDTTEWCSHQGMTRGPSWAELTTFQNTYGMRFISHSATYQENWPKLTAQRQYDETCGSRNAITAHGLLGANGQFDWPHNIIDPNVQATYVEPCFYFNRTYSGTGVNTLASTLANHDEVSTKQAYGGSCNTTGQPCSSVLPFTYVLPQTIINRIKTLQPGQHYSLQTYLLVTKTNPVYATNTTRWDCSSSDPTLHWSNDVERYCWVDFKRILTFLQNDKNVVVTDPQSVAVAWGMTPPSM